MAIAIKQIMLITRNVQFAIDVKRALEALGEYSVTTVAEVRNAIEQLRDAPQQLVLLDTENLTVSPAIMIEMIRSRQRDLAIVLAPDRPAVHELARRYGVEGVVDIPVLARSLIPILDRSLVAAYGSLPESPSVENIDVEPVSEDTVTIESLLGHVLEGEVGLNYTRRRLQASLELLNPTPDTTAPRNPLELLTEPEIDESDTVRFRFLKTGEEGASTTLAIGGTVLDETPLLPPDASETVADLAAELRGEPKPVNREAQVDQATLDVTDIEDSAAFEKLLDSVLDESTALENLTLESLFDTTRELPDALGTGAVPKWLRETEKFIREPSFLPEALPPLESSSEISETTIPSVADATVPETESGAGVESPATSEIQAEESQIQAPAAASGWSPLSTRVNDPYLAQLALTMTRTMSDLTADATVLTRENRIVAFSGDMALGDFRALRGEIADDWNAAVDQSRIRFVKLPDSDSEIMLCSRRTVAGHCLTLIFGAGKQLREIRVQGDRLLCALADVPESNLVEADACRDTVSAGADARQPFAFVWLVADPALVLRKHLAEQLVFWLEVQLNGLNWRVHRLDVHQDFIYLYADVPGRASPDLLARTVMERSRKIACSEDRALPEDLWADAYLVLQPGRDMDERELQNFLQFARA